MSDTELYNPDEFVLKDVDMVHWETMSAEHLWCAFYLKNGNIGHLNIFLKDGKIHTRYEEFDESYSNRLDLETKGMDQ
jgi:hypothetical protein